jgi:hypothetical protein
MPASISAAQANPFAWSRVETHASKPYSVAFANRTASSNPPNATLGAPGPKISSRKMSEFGSTFGVPVELLYSAGAG